MRPTRATGWKRTFTAETVRCPYLVLLLVGFALPLSFLTARCALTTPFHPYLANR